MNGLQCPNYKCNSTEPLTQVKGYETDRAYYKCAACGYQIEMRESQYSELENAAISDLLEWERNA